MIYLLDTNIVSQAMRANPKVIERLKQLEHGRVAMSAVTFAEIEYGIMRFPKGQKGRTRRRSELKALFDALLTYVDVLPWDRAAAMPYAHTRIDCEVTGMNLDQADLMIAAHAVSSGATLVTDDAALLRRSKSSSSPKIVNWLA